MILPSKHLPQERALLTIGAEVLIRLDRPKTVSSLWEELGHKDTNQKDSAPNLGYDWFVLALDLLYAIGAIDFKSGIIRRRSA